MSKAEATAERPEAKSAPILLPKITLKDIGCNPKAILATEKDPKTRLMLARIYGVATDTRQQKRTNENTGEVVVYEKLVGEFRAINLSTGQRYKSAILYLPGGIHEIVSGPIDHGKKDSEAVEISFGFDLFTKHAENAAGYGYGAIILGEPQEDDAISRLEREIEGKSPLPALEAPK